jgi:hypothetical protein
MLAQNNLRRTKKAPDIWATVPIDWAKEPIVAEPMNMDPHILDHNDKHSYDLNPALNPKSSTQFYCYERDFDRNE